MSTPRILFIAPRVPWPLDTGGKIRTYYQLRALARKFPVRLLTFGEPAGDSAGQEAMEDLGAVCELIRPPGRLARLHQLAHGLAGPMPYTVRKYWREEMSRRLASLARGQVDLLHCDHLHMAPYGPPSGLPYVVDEHNVESIIWERFSQDGEEPRRRRYLFRQQAFWLRRLERRLCAQAALVLLCSQADEDALVELAGDPRPRTKIVPNGVDLDYFSAPGPAESSGHLFFTGSMDWAPNENAVITFLDDMWPQVRDRHRDVPFFVVGRNPSALLRSRHGSRGVVVTGTVPDVRPFMRGALALVVPMRVGGGTRLKILEAFAARVPVISTALGIEGIQAVPETHYLLAESASDFTRCVDRLRQDPDLGRRLTAEAFDLGQQKYSWDAVGDVLTREYRRSFGS